MTGSTRALRALSAIFVLWSWQAAAEETSPPVEPAAVGVPDLSFTPTERDIRAYSDYFYFHKDGVTYANALAAMKECSSYSEALTPMAPTLDFVPIGGAPDPNAKSKYNEQVAMNSFRFGLVGSVMASIILNGSQTERSNTRRCMGYLGYQRYGISRSIWSKLAKGSDEETLKVFALIASGPHPQAEALEP
jgi:hypothetical protein